MKILKISKICYLFQKLGNILIIFTLNKIILHFLTDSGILDVLPSSLNFIIMCLKVVWHSVNRFSPFTSRSYSVTFLISWVSYFLCSHSWRISPSLLIGLEAGSVSLNSVMDLGLSQMNCFSLIQLEQSF